MIEHIKATTTHVRHGSLSNVFRYTVDYVLTDFHGETPGLFSRNRFNLWSLHDCDHGGPRGAGTGVAWFRDILAQRGFDFENADLLLLAQPQFLGARFTPVSFWIAIKEGAPRAFVAEVNNTVGQRHCYLCAHPKFAPIQRDDLLFAEKLMHVSPFQTVEGEYAFKLGLTDDCLTIRIDYRNGENGVLATLGGTRKTANAASLASAALRRPFGGARVMALILWQALKLKLRGAVFTRKQPEPETLLSEPQKKERQSA